MRISGGQAKGIPISTGRARQVRPATDRMREAVFSSLGEHVPGSRFLDLFAGSGSYGLEALSRGAGGGLFVEKDTRALEALKENLRSVMKSLGIGAGDAPGVVRRDVLRFHSRVAFTLVFMDPPYTLARERGPELLHLARGFLDRDHGALLVYELPADLSLPATGWQCRRRIGKTGRNEPAILILEPAD